MSINIKLRIFSCFLSAFKFVFLSSVSFLSFLSLFSFLSPFLPSFLCLCGRLVVNQEGQPLIEGKLKEKQVRWKFIKRWKTRYFTLAGNQLLFRRGKSVRSQWKRSLLTQTHTHAHCPRPLIQRALINISPFRVVWIMMKLCMKQWKPHRVISSTVPQERPVNLTVTNLGIGEDWWGGPKAKAWCCNNMSHSDPL